MAVQIERTEPSWDSAGKLRPTTWRWTCDCHWGRKSVPWPERPTDSNAQAEHDLVLKHWPTERHGGRKAPKPHELP